MYPLTRLIWQNWLFRWTPREKTGNPMNPIMKRLVPGLTVSLGWYQISKSYYMIHIEIIHINYSLQSQFLLWSFDWIMGLIPFQTSWSIQHVLSEFLTYVRKRISAVILFAGTTLCIIWRMIWIKLRVETSWNGVIGLGWVGFATGL